MRLPILSACLLALPLTAAAEQFDSTFATGGRHVTSSATLAFRAVASLPMPSGEVVIVGEYPHAPGQCADTACIGLGRLDANGGFIDTRIKAAALASVTAAAVDSSGHIVVVGATMPGANGADFGVVRFNPDLSDDTGFAGDGGTGIDHVGLDDYPTAVAIDAQDRIVVAGSFGYAATDTDFGVVRLLGDGTPDLSFNVDGRTNILFDLGPNMHLDQANALAIGNDGKIVVVGVALDSAISRVRVGLARLDADGELDSSFCDPDCSTNLYPSVHSGRTTYYFGTPSAHADEAFGVDTLADGGFLIAGTTYTADSTSHRGALARFFPNGGYMDERLEDGLGGSAVFRSVRSVDASGSRIIVSGDSGPAQNYFLLQAFSFSLDPEVDYGNCLTDNSGFCFIFGTGLGDDGPDEGTSLEIDARGRVLFQGYGVASTGTPSQILTARFSNDSGPLPDLIFRNGFN